MHDHKAVLELIDRYCYGIYHGDIDRLRDVFHKNALLFAEVRGESFCRTIEEYLDIVSNRPSPHALGERFRMRPVSVEVTHEIAIAKVHCPMFDYNYMDYLSFVRRNGVWRIVNKVFTDVPVPECAGSTPLDRP